MNVEIRKRKHLGSGWTLYEGVVNGKVVGVRLPTSYIESVSDQEGDSEVRQSLKEEYERQTQPT